MIIAVDIGNTNIVLGCLDKNKTYFTARISTDKSKTTDEYALMIRNLFHLNSVDRQAIEGGIISSVVPSLSSSVQEAVKKVTDVDCIIVGSGIKTGLNILMDDPAKLGADLVVDAVAATAQYDKPIIIFDMGTATTMSVIDSKGNYIGGMIIPGAMLALEAVASKTSQLPHVSLDAPKKLIGSNTVDCMKAGIVYGNASMIDGLIERVNEELGETATVVATGGVAGTIVPFCKKKIIYDADLLLKGLQIIYYKNKH